MSRSKQAMHGNRALRETGPELDVHVRGDAADEGMDPPAPVGASSARQDDVAIRGDVDLVRNADQIDQARDRMRTDFEERIARLAKHPVAERTEADERQLGEIVDRDVPDRPQIAATDMVA